MSGRAITRELDTLRLVQCQARPVRLTRRGRLARAVVIVLGAALFFTVGLLIAHPKPDHCTLWEDGGVSCTSGLTYCLPGTPCDDSAGGAR